MSEDPSNGYEAAAAAFLRARSGIGLALVQRWAGELPRGGAVLDAGAGAGVPLAAALLEAGLRVYAVDASPTLAAAFRERFPQAEIACEPVEQSRFFKRSFEGVLAIGLVFLLAPSSQEQVLTRLGGVLQPGGRLLFTAPREVCAWDDALTGRRSQSLGAEVYRRILAEAGLRLLGEPVDEGGNQYYEAVKAIAWPSG